MAPLVMLMGQTAKSNAAANAEVKQPTVFHDFLGSGESNPCVSLASKNNKAAGDSGGDVVRLLEVSPSVSGSVAAASGGARGPFSPTSDLGSERQAGNQYNRIGCYGPRSDLSMPEISNRFAGSKRSNSDSAFVGTSSERLPQTGQESFESSPLLKMLRHGAGAEWPRSSHYNGHFHGLQQGRPSSASLMLQPISGNSLDGNFSKLEQSIPVNMRGSMQYTMQTGKTSPFVYQLPSSRCRDSSTGPSILSQTAADEGSRTGIKGSGILSSINAGRVLSEKNPSGMPGSSKMKPAALNFEPESSNPPSQCAVTSVSRQMTIIYGGQVHVFDDVHPNKADVIMTLAGSNGGCWSTTLPKSTSKSAHHESVTPDGENETGRLTTEDTRNPIHAAKSSAEDKREDTREDTYGPLQRQTGTPA
ncbi:hypothetical protein Ancab_022741 [Ancistrocladus abbreviatus]